MDRVSKARSLTLNAVALGACAETMAFTKQRELVVIEFAIVPQDDRLERQPGAELQRLEAMECFEQLRAAGK